MKVLPVPSKKLSPSVGLAQKVDIWARSELNILDRVKEITWPDMFLNSFFEKMLNWSKLEICLTWIISTQDQAEITAH